MKSDPLTATLRQARQALVWVGLFSLAINLLMLAGPLYMLQVYDRVLASGRAETLVMLTVMLGAAILAGAVLETQRSSLTLRLGAWFQQVLGPTYLRGGLRAKLTGDGGGAQAFRDLGQVQSFVGTQGMSAFFDFPWTPLFIGAIWLLHPWLGLLALSTAVALLVLSVFNDLATRRLLREANEGQIRAQRLAEAAIDNADAAHAMGMGPALTDRWRACNAGSQTALLQAAERGGRITGTAKFIRLFAQSAILGLGAFLVIRGETTPGVMIASSILLSRALAPVDVAMQAWRNFSQARIALGRLRERASATRPEPDRIDLPAPRGGLQVRGLTATGATGPILRQVSFDLLPGEAAAVIGPSAAGKSTLARHLVGLARPARGSVALDGIRIDRWRPDALGRHVGFLPQDVGLFEGTIRDNIGRFDEVSDAEIVAAARLAQAHEMIAELPEGYATRLGPGGSGLSGGQRQRIGLARAVFGMPALVVLDEPNANLDQTGEAALAAAIAELKALGSTLVIIGHRPSTLAQVDKVLILREGAVHAFGPRADVLDRLRATQSSPQPIRRQDAQATPDDELAKRPGARPGDRTRTDVLRLERSMAISHEGEKST